MYVFSGPSNAVHALEAEKEACMHVLNILVGKICEGIRVLICSDSIETVSYVESLRYDPGENREIIIDIISVLGRVEFRVINRRFNMEADGLAKEGINRSSLVEGWV